MNDDVIDQVLSKELVDTGQSSLTSFIYNEMDHVNDNDNDSLNIQLAKSDFLDQIEYFNNNYESEFQSLEIPQKIKILREIRQKIITKTSPLFKFYEKSDILSEFINILVHSHQCNIVLMNIEILRIFNRMSQTYSEFLNPYVINEFNELMKIRTSKNEHPLVRHYALICIGKVVRQSVKWAEETLINYQYVFDGIDDDFNSNEYYEDLKHQYYQLLVDTFGDSIQISGFTIINHKKGDPYIYALRGFTKMLSNTDRLQGRIEEIIKKILGYFQKARINGTIDIFSGSEKIEILNDIIESNYQGTFKTLYICKFMVEFFFNEFIPLCERSLIFSLLNPTMKLISSFYNNGEQYTIFFNDFKFDFILKMMLYENQDNLKGGVYAAECIYSIINLKKEEGVSLFFGDENKYPDFIGFIELIIGDNLPYVKNNLPFVKKIAFYKLAGKIFEHFIWKSIDFQLHLFIKVALESMDQGNYLLSVNALYALYNLYLRSQLLGISKDFNQMFIEWDGKDSIERIINEEQGELYDLAASFMSGFDGFDE